MSAIYVCDRCGSVLNESSCPNQRYYVLRIGLWFDIHTSAINSGSEEVPMDLCGNCYDELMKFMKAVDKKER